MARSSGRQKRKRSTAPAVHKLRVKHVFLPSLIRVSLVFYVGLVVVSMLATIVGWMLLSSVGLVAKVNHLIDQLIGSTTYSVSLAQVLVVQIGLGIAWVIVATIMTYIAGAVYNLSSEMGNGIVVGVTDDGN